MHSIAILSFGNSFALGSSPLSALAFNTELTHELTHESSDIDGSLEKLDLVS
jgi:hypothetical protein